MHPRRAAPTALLLLLGVLAAASVLAAPRESAAQRRVIYYGVYPVRPTWIERPLTTERRHIDLYGGLAFGYADYFRYHREVGNRPMAGWGHHFELMAGLLDFLEIGAGVGFRFNYDGTVIGADRYARVDREWLPTYPSAGPPGDYVTNPYIRLRVAFVNHAPFMIGFEAYHTLPVVPGTCFGFGLGLPMHIIAGHYVRFETGLWHEFSNVCVPFNTNPFAFYAPIRINFQITPRFWLGFRGALDIRSYRLDAGYVNFETGFQGGVRIIPRLDFVFNVVFPEFFRWEATLNRPVFFDHVGFGIGLIGRVL